MGLHFFTSPDSIILKLSPKRNPSQVEPHSRLASITTQLVSPFVPILSNHVPDIVKQEAGNPNTETQWREINRRQDNRMVHRMTKSTTKTYAPGARLLATNNTGSKVMVLVSLAANPMVVLVSLSAAVN